MQSESRHVTADEARALRVARAVVGFAPASAVLDLIQAGPGPVRFSPNGMEVLKDTLARGLVRELVRRGGHRPVRAGPGAARGRLWERHSPIGLHLLAPSMALLRWLVEAPGNTSAALTPPCSLGDELFAYLVADLLLRCHRTRLLEQPLFARCALVAAAFPLQVADLPDSIQGSSYFEGDGAVLVEALGRDLARRVAGTDRERLALSQPTAAMEAGARIERGPVAFARAAIASGRPDLALFLLEGVERILGETGASPEPLASRGRGASLPLADRQRIARGALPLLECALEFRKVARTARAIGFLDDGYERAQSTISLLEPWMDGGFDRIEVAIRSLEKI